MIKLHPMFYGVTLNVEDFRDAITEMWNDWQPPAPGQLVGLDEFFIRADTHYLPFVRHVQGKERFSQVPIFAVGAALFQARKTATAKVKPFKR